MKGWELKRYFELYEIPSRNGIMRPSSVRGKGYKMINMGELFAYPRIKNQPMELVELTDEEKNRFGIENGDLLFARQSLVAEGAGKCSIVIDIEKPATYESHLIRTRLNKSSAYPLYFFYYFSSKAGFGSIQTLVNQVSAAGIRGSDLDKLKLHLPPLPIQKKIAAVLSAYDDLIETNERRIQILERMAEELYKEWFVRLRFPGHETTKIVKGVPEGWEVKRVGEVVEFLSGFSFKSVTFSDTGKLGIVTIKNVQDGYFVKECTDYIDDYPSNMKDYCKLQKGDMLLSLTGNVGRVCHVIGENLLLNQRVAKLRSRFKQTNSFIYYTFKNKSMQSLIENLSLGSTAQMNLSTIDLSKQKFIFPNINLLSKFESIILPAIQWKLSLLENISILKTSRDRLLSRLVSGKIDLSGLDIQFPPSMEEK